LPNIGLIIRSAEWALQESGLVLAARWRCVERLLVLVNRTHGKRRRLLLRLGSELRTLIDLADETDPGGLSLEGLCGIDSSLLLVEA
jgi:hypothetical protein